MSTERLLTVEDLQPILSELRELRSAVQSLTRTEPDFYTVNEFAKLTGWAPYTIRQWCNEGKLKARADHRKRDSWEIDPDEVKRVKRKTVSQAPR